MTGTEIYTAALAVLSQEPGDNEKWDRMAVSWLNLALAQALPTENSLREEGGFSLLSAAPRVETLEEKVKVHERLYAALVNALAAQLWEDAREPYKAQDYRQRFAQELADARVSVPHGVMDWYG